jgi:hypothetical protein
MKPAIALLVGLVLNGAVPGAELTGLKVLYVGSERSSEFVEFLKGKVATVEAKSRESFQPRDAARFDVVLVGTFSCPPHLRGDPWTIRH